MTFALNLICDTDVSSRTDFIELRTRELVVNSSRRRASQNKLLHGVGICDATTGYVDPITGELKKTPAYAAWCDMYKRCYSQKGQANNPTYAGVTVCPEWLYFSAFEEWHDANFIPGCDLDKDLVKPGNKVYGPEFCRYVPHYINLLTVSCSARRGSWPLGVSHSPERSKFRAECSYSGKVHFLGRFDDSMSAHHVWQLGKARAIELTVERYMMTEEVVHIEVVRSLVAYADRLKEDARAGRETVGY